MSLPNDTIGTAIPLPASPFAVDLRDAQPDYSGWGNDVFYTWTAPSDGQLAMWHYYADDPDTAYRTQVLFWDAPLSDADYIDFTVSDLWDDFDTDPDRTGSLMPVVGGQTYIISLSRPDYNPAPPGVTHVTWTFTAVPENAGAVGGTSTALIGQQKNAGGVGDRSGWRWNAITRFGSTIEIAATVDMDLNSIGDVYQSNHCVCRIDDNRALWVYEYRNLATFPAVGFRVMGRVVVFDGSTITFGPEADLGADVSVDSTDFDNAQVACSDGSIALLALKHYAGGDTNEWFVTIGIGVDNTLTRLDTQGRTQVNSYDAVVIGTGPGRALSWKYSYPSAGNRFLTKITWDTDGIITLGTPVILPLPPFDYDYYQSFLDFVGETAFLSESWQVNGPGYRQREVIGVRAINPDTLEYGALSTNIEINDDDNVTDFDIFETCEWARQMTQVGLLADGTLGIAYPRAAPNAKRVLEFVVMPLSLEGLVVTPAGVEAERTLLYRAEDPGGSAFTVFDTQYMYIRNVLLYYGLAITWLYDDIDQYHHIIAQSISSTGGQGYQTLDLDADTHYTWLICGLNGTVSLADLSGGPRGVRVAFRGR